MAGAKHDGAVWLLWQHFGSKDFRLLGAFTTEEQAKDALRELADQPDDGWMRNMLSVTTMRLDELDLAAVVRWPIPPGQE